MNISVTVKLLNELEMLGFNDEAFWRLHHRRLSGHKDTINAHRKYCLSLKTGSFIPGEDNALVTERLVYVLEIYRAAELPNGNAGAFIALAEAAFRAIPPLGNRLGH
jgi:hypothetical protein